MKVTLISDTHTKHNQLNGDLPGGDLLIHAGDFMNSGYYKTEAIEFFNWFEAIDNYDTKIFIAGNHDRIMENEPEWVKGYLTGYKTIDYLQDEQVTLYFDGPNGDTDILITHGPAQTYLDTAGAPYNTPLLGCELLKERIELIKPKIHVCGHIHGGYGYYYNGHTHFFNASILDERYNYANKPFHFEWDPITNQITWL